MTAERPPSARDATRAGENAEPAIALAQAYARCEAITRERAANFYYGIRLLPGAKRRAMCAIYAFARRIDDIGDGELSPAQKLAALQRQQRALARLARDGAVEQHDAVMVALADAAPRFSLPLEALGDLIAGVGMDVQGTRYERFEELLLYCRRVAGAIGRLCLAVFDVRFRDAAQAARAGVLADDLGVALQLTNVLRDVREDAALGRVYLPAQDLRRFGLLAGDAQPLPALWGALARADAAPQLAQLVRFEAERARGWFARSIELVELLDRRSAACVLAMAGIYRRLLERIAADPQRALQRRMRLSPWEKAWVAVASMLAFERRPLRRGPSARAAADGRR